MNPLQLLNAQDPASRSLSGGAPSDPRHGQEASGRDLSWQRALEHAQQASFATWFMPLPPVGETVALHTLRAPIAPATSTQAAAPSAPHVSAPRPPAAVDLGPSSTTRTPSPEAEIVHPTRPTASASTSLPQASTGTDPVVPKATLEPSTGTLLGSPASLPGPAAKPPSWAADPASLEPVLAQRVADLCACPVALVPAFDPGALSPLHLLPQTAAPLTAVASAMPPPPESLLVPTTAQPPVSLSPAPESIPDMAAAPTTSSASTPPPQPSAKPAIRLHAEWSEQGVRIWLGADAAQSLPLEQLTLQLRQWLTGQGAQLLNLVCNGKTIWGEGTPRGIPTPEAEFKTPPDPAFPYPVYQSSTSALATGRVHAY